MTTPRQQRRMALSKQMLKHRHRGTTHDINTRLEAMTATLDAALARLQTIERQLTDHELEDLNAHDVAQLRRPLP